MTSRKAQKEAENNEFMEEVSKEAQGIIDKVVKDVGKSSATRQLIIGSASGWYVNDIVNFVFVYCMILIVFFLSLANLLIVYFRKVKQ